MKLFAAMFVYEKSNKPRCASVGGIPSPRGLCGTMPDAPMGVSVREEEPNPVERKTQGKKKTPAWKKGKIPEKAQKHTPEHTQPRGTL
jgi:hypothetical protein